MPDIAIRAGVQSDREAPRNCPFFTGSVDQEEADSFCAEDVTPHVWCFRCITGLSPAAAGHNGHGMIAAVIVSGVRMSVVVSRDTWNE